MNIIWKGAHTNNYTVGREGKSIDKVVLHWIVGTLESADGTFANPDRKASAHYGIGDDKIHQYVKESDTAWHASNWSVNQTSIGIEHEGGWLLDNGSRFKPTNKTHETSARLVADICRRYDIPIDHDHIKPHNAWSATQCPGSLDIDRIINMARDFSVPPPSSPTPPAGVVTDLKTKIDLGDNWGVQELQAVISMLNDMSRDLENTKKNCNDRILLAEEQARLQEKSFWQSELESANDKMALLEQTISELRSKKLSEYHWRVLMSQAWKNWWAEKRGDIA